MTQLIAVLFSLFVFFHGIATAEEASKEKGIFGAWLFQEAILEHRDIYPKGEPFPESFIIESVSPDEGRLSVKLPAQSQPKVYSFSKLESTQHSSVQFYDNPSASEEDKVHAIRETVEINYEENSVKVNLVWLNQTSGISVPVGYISEGSYEFVYQEDEGHLIFTRVNEDTLNPDKAKQHTVWTALYKRVP